MRELPKHYRAIADNDSSISLDSNRRNGPNKHTPAIKRKAPGVSRDPGTTPDARSGVVRMHGKPRFHEILIWIGGDIEHYLGLAGPKDIGRRTPYRQRPAGKPL